MFPDYQDSEFTCVTLPGLAPTPALRYDSKTNRAIISVRVANWRSWSRAVSASKIVHWSTTSVFAWWEWNNLVILDDPMTRVCVTAIGSGLCFAFTKAPIHTIFDGFFARQVFSSCTRIWFSPEFIAVRSSLFRKPILFWRNFQNEPVEVKFDVAQDHDAVELSHLRYQRSNQFQLKTQTACVLRLILSSASSHRPVTMNNIPLMRAIPILEADQRDAPRVATVLMAAAALTSKQPDARGEQGTGLDVDLIPMTNFTIHGN
jgi:hypothetical protein